LEDAVESIEMEKNMTLRKTLLIAFCLILTISFLSACSLPRRKNLEIASFSQPLTLKIPSQIVVQFEQTIQGKPLTETVWDNVKGPFWDVKESNQIGFTQNYQPQFFAVPPPLLPAVAQSGVHLIDTRIVVPFGNIFSGVFVSAIEKNGKEMTACFDQLCLAASPVPDVLKVKIERFLVWEDPLNHLNFYAKGFSSYSRNHIAVKEYAFERSLLTQKLGSVLSTHNTFIIKMNSLSNQFAEEITTDVLKNTLK
jgi:hypothetical protein